MHYYKSSNEIMQYCIFSNDIALIMHYHALLKRSDSDQILKFMLDDVNEYKKKSRQYFFIFQFIRENR